MGGKKHKDVPPCSRPTSCPGRLTSSRQTLAAINLVHLNLPSPLLPCYNLRSYQLRPATYSCVYWKLWFHQNPLLLIYIFFVCVFFLVRASAFVCLRIRVYSFGFVLSGCCFFLHVLSSFFESVLPRLRNFSRSLRRVRWPRDLFVCSSFATILRF